MIQLNLLPDVKLEFINAQRARRQVIALSILISGAAVGLLVLLLLWDFGQKAQLSHINHQIKDESSKLQNEPDINKVLTVQNQLESLTGLHAQKPAASNLFNYMNQITPAAVSISNFATDFTQQTATITGTADSLSSVNQYIDTLKFTTYTSDTLTTDTNAFSNVVLTSFSLDNTSDPAHAASYTINLSYDKNIFDITQNVKISVPHQVTTRSALAQPTDLFQASSSSGGKKP